jgi:hypothetical protein
MPESSSAQPYAHEPGLTVAPSSGLWRKPKGALDAGAEAPGPVPPGVTADAAPGAGALAVPVVSVFWQAARLKRSAADPMAVVVFPNTFKIVLLA